MKTPTHVRYLRDIKFFNGLADIKAGEVVRVTKYLASNSAWVVRDNGDSWAELRIDGKHAEFCESPALVMKNEITQQTSLERAITSAKQGGTWYIFQTGHDQFTVTFDKNAKGGVFVAQYTNGNLVRSNWKLSEMARNA